MRDKVRWAMDDVRMWHDKRWGGVWPMHRGGSAGVTPKGRGC